MSKEHAYAYEAGYHDGATHYELDHCPSCKNLADLQDALDENVKLWELSKDLFSALFNEASRQHVTTIGEMQDFLDRMAELNILQKASKLGIEADK